MPIPERQEGEERDEFVSRCVSALDGEYDREQALAICYQEAGKAQTYSDYPQAASDNAQRALDIKEETDSNCGTRVGWERANQLASREALSKDTIGRMASFNRHRQNSDGDPKEDCGALMWLAWGGDAGIDWAINKMDELDGKSMSVKEKLQSMPSIKQADERANIEFKQFTIGKSEDGRTAKFKGIGNVMNVEDYGGDVIHAGAFRKTTKENPVVYFLADHKYYTDDYLGVAYLDEKGENLEADVELLLEDNPKGKEFYAKAKHAQEHGIPFGMSIGYSIPKGKWEYDKEGIRHIYEAMVHELSGTMFPMNEGSRIEMIKSRAQNKIDEALSVLQELKSSLINQKPSEDTSGEEAERELLAKLAETKQSLKHS